MKFKKYFFLIQCIIFCNQYNFVISLVGPNVRLAEPNEFPSVVSIIRLNNNDSQKERYHKCTATLISLQDVLTAQHCLRTTLTQGFKLLVGSIDLREATEFSPLLIWTYEHWALFRHRTIDSSLHDIAIIKLIGNVPDTINFAPIGNIPRELLFGLHAEIPGWGRLSDNSKPRFLHTATVRILTKSEFRRLYFRLIGAIAVVDRRVLTSVGNPYAILHRGDSGGPLLYNGVVIGVSHGISPAVQGIPQPHHINLHVGIRYFIDFIEDVKTTFYVNF